MRRRLGLSQPFKAHWQWSTDAKCARNGLQVRFQLQPQLIQDGVFLIEAIFTLIFCNHKFRFRQIKGPFADPIEITLDSLILGKDYRNLILLSADPTKEFLWDSNAESYIEYETKNNKKIVHGRAIL